MRRMRPTAFVLLLVSLLVAIVLPNSVMPASAVDVNYVFLRKWGEFGQNNEQFRYPNSVAVTDYVYVADYENRFIKKFTLDGTFVSKRGGEVGPPQMNGPSRLLKNPCLVIRL